MRFAYADPPYFGQGRKRYAQYHPDAAVWDDKQTHLDLVAQLYTQFPNGWALSCNPADLSWIMPTCYDARVTAWCKTFHQIRPLASVQYAWEPVIVYGGRKVPNRKPMVRDWMACARTMRKGLVGAKPAAFNAWVLQMLGFQHGDEMVDLFPGTGGMAIAVNEVDA
jgi:hypothetical protein